MGYCEICGVNSTGMEAEIRALRAELELCENLRSDTKRDRDKWKSLAKRMGKELEYLCEYRSSHYMFDRHLEDARKLLTELEEMT